MENNLCPNCGSTEFITEPNQYDVLIFSNNSFEIKKSEQIEGYKVFCRECSEEIDLFESIEKITLKIL